MASRKPSGCQQSASSSLSEDSERDVELRGLRNVKMTFYVDCARRSVDFTATRNLHRFRDGSSGCSQSACWFHKGNSSTSMPFALPGVAIERRRSRVAGPPSVWRFDHSSHPSRSHVNVVEPGSPLSSGDHSLAAHLALLSLPPGAPPVHLSRAGHSDEPDQETKSASTRSMPAAHSFRPRGFSPPRRLSPQTSAHEARRPATYPDVPKHPELVGQALPSGHLASRFTHEVHRISPSSLASALTSSASDPSAGSRPRLSTLTRFGPLRRCCARALQ